MTDHKPAERANDPVAEHVRQPVWTTVAALGMGLTLTATVMLISRWLPWESRDSYSLYMMSGGTIDSLSLITAGTVCLCAGLVGLGAKRGARLFAGLCIALALAVAIVYAGLLSSLPGVTEEAAQSSFDTRMVRFGILRASLGAAISIMLYLWFAWTAWRLPGRTAHKSR